MFTSLINTGLTRVSTAYNNNQFTSTSKINKYNHRQSVQCSERKIQVGLSNE